MTVEKEAREFRTLVERRATSLVPVHEPLVLISQIQRSGGTLLSQLFDAHPEVHAHPHELKIGSPTKYDWPPIDPSASAEVTFELLKTGSKKHYKLGYAKADVGASSGVPADGRARYPFLLPRRLQLALFERLASEWSWRTDRDVLDAYFTSYFNAWLDNQNLYARPKRVVTAFVPRLGVRADAHARLRAAYPDGMLVSIVREPKAWYASARRHDPDEYADAGTAAALWEESTKGAIEAKRLDPERTILLSFERLVEEPEAVMRFLAARLGLSFDDVLLTPSFNGMPMVANSSFDTAAPGIVRGSARRAEALDAEPAQVVDRVTAETYAAAQAALDER